MGIVVILKLAMIALLFNKRKRGQQLDWLGSYPLLAHISLGKAYVGFLMIL